MRGLTDEAAAALATLEDRRHPSWRYLDYELCDRPAWVAACQGAVSEAIATLLSAAETARANGQFAAEVMCLQTAAQFGDRSGAPRLRELAAIVEGPRAGVAARFAAALAAGDGAELAAVSEDSSGWAIWLRPSMRPRTRPWRIAAKACGDRRWVRARADVLAEQCGGASTPALGQASETLPLTEREREIVMLIGDGLPSRAVAARLTLSVRTVEGHIYRAMAKTGATSRDELAALLPRRSPVHKIVVG